MTNIALALTRRHWLTAGLLAFVLLLGPGAAFAKTAPDSFADLAEELLPSVVNISTTQVIEGRRGPDRHLPRGERAQSLLRVGAVLLEVEQIVSEVDPARREAPPDQGQEREGHGWRVPEALPEEEGCQDEQVLHPLGRTHRPEEPTCHADIVFDPCSGSRNLVPCRARRMAR